MKINFLTRCQGGSWLKLSLAAVLLITSCAVENESVDISGEVVSNLSLKSVELPISSISSDTKQHKDSYIDLAIDNDEDSKWLAYGSQVNVDLDLGGTQKLDYLKLSFYEGDDKIFSFKVYALVDGLYKQVGSKKSIGTSTSLETFDLSDSETRYVRIQFSGNDIDDSNGLYDIEAWGVVLEEIEEPVDDPVAVDGFGPPTAKVGEVSWQNWYLSVPIDRADGSGKATSIFYEDIQALNFTEEESWYFDQNADGSYKMNAKFTGYTTSGYYESFGSKYCRTELREFWQGFQTTSDNWYMDSGKHELETTLSVERCEGEGKTYVAQIHGVSGTSLSGTELTGSPATVKVQWYNDDIILEYYTPEGVVGGEWTSASGTVGKVTLGKVANNKFTVRLKVDEGRLYAALYCESTGVDTGYVEYIDFLDLGYEYQNYFKTGNYYRHDEDYTSVSGVTLYSALTWHTAK